MFFYYTQRLQPLTSVSFVCVCLSANQLTWQAKYRKLMCSIVLCHGRMKSSRPKSNGHFSLPQRQILFPWITEAKSRAKRTKTNQDYTTILQFHNIDTICIYLIIEHKWPFFKWTAKTKQQMFHVLTIHMRLWKISWKPVVSY